MSADFRLQMRVEEFLACVTRMKGHLQVALRCGEGDKQHQSSMQLSHGSSDPETVHDSPRPSVSSLNVFDELHGTTTRRSDVPLMSQVLLRVDL